MEESQKPRDNRVLHRRRGNGSVAVLDKGQKIEQRFLNESGNEDVATLHRYIEYNSFREFYGQMIISWEKGVPVTVKNHETLKMKDIRKLLKG